MSDTITACENVCRDFSFIWFAEPRIVQGFLTILAALIGSGTALYIALRAYPRQKEIDHNNELKREQREAYRLFFRETVSIRQFLFHQMSFATYEEAKNSIGELNRAKVEYLSAISELGITSSKAVMDIAVEMNNLLLEVTHEMGDALLQIAPAEDEFVDKSIVIDAVRSVAKNNSPRFDSIENRLRAAMRSEEFGGGSVPMLKVGSYAEPESELIS